MGRPTKFNRKAVDKAKKYVNDCLRDKTMPFIETLALEILNVDDDTVVEWTKSHDTDDDETLKLRNEFSATIKRLKTNQRRHLMNQGLAGKVNTTMAIFLLKSNHGLKEVDRHEHTGKDGAELPSPTNNTMIIYRPKKLPYDYDFPKEQDQPKPVESQDGSTSDSTANPALAQANNGSQ